MKKGVLRAAGIGILGAIAGAGALAAAYIANPEVAFDMDRDLPRFVSGFYPVERSGTTTFAWASRRATLSLPGADRRTPWTCAVRFRGGRADETTQPMVELTIDGTPLASRLATNTYEVIEATAPPAPFADLRLAITSSTTFVPGPGDRRELAIQVEWFACRPATSGIVLPPRRAIAAGAIGGATFGLAFLLAGISFRAVTAGVLVLALVQALPLAAGTAPFGRAAYPAAGLSCWIALTTVLVAKALEWWKGEPLQRREIRADVQCGSVVYQAACPAASFQASCRCRLPGTSPRVGPRRPFLLHATDAKRCAVPVRHRALRLCRAVVARDSRLCDASSNCSLRV